MLLFTDIIGKGHSAFLQTQVAVEINFDADYLGITDASDPQQLMGANFDGLVKKSLRERFPDVKARRDKRSLYSLVSSGSGFRLQKLVAAEPELLGTTRTVWLLADDDIDAYYKSRKDTGEAFTGRMSEKKLAWIESLIGEDKVRKAFKHHLLYQR